MRFHITFIFGFEVVKILIPSWKRIVIVMARRQIAAVRSMLRCSFSHKIISYIDLFKTNLYYNATEQQHNIEMLRGKEHPRVKLKLI